MKRITLLSLLAVLTLMVNASTTLPIKGKVINPTDKHIQYIGRICFDNPMCPRFTFTLVYRSTPASQVPV